MFVAAGCVSSAPRTASTSVATSSSPTTHAPAITTTTVAASSTLASAITVAARSVPSSTTSTDPDTTATTAPAKLAPTRTFWLTFGGSADRRSSVAAGPDPRIAGVRWRSPPLDGLVYGQALVVDQTVIVATEGDTVYGLAAADGHVLWSSNLGQAVRRSSLPCGNIDPTGITSTPVIDATGATVYVVSFTQPAHHELVALDVASGAVRWRHAIDPPGLSPLVEQQRSALTIANGRVYVAFGGLYGDCGPYKGAVVSLAADGSGEVASWIVPTVREGGLWAPSGPAVDAAGNLWAAVGNAASTSTFDYGNSVVRLTPDLALVDWWAPKDWAVLSATDADLGSQGPVLLDVGHVFVAGKAGVGFVLSTTNLGHIGGEVSSRPLCGAAFGGSASNGSVVVLACSVGVTAASVDGGGSLTATWRVGGGRSGPPVIAGPTAWYASNDGHLRAVDLTSGQVLSNTVIRSGLEGFPPVTVTTAAVYVGGTNVITAVGA